MADRYAWFSEWVDQHLALTFTVGVGPTAADVPAAFGASAFEPGECTMDVADDSDVPIVRVGADGDRVYTVEHFSTRGGDPAVLGRLSAGGLVVAMCFTQTMSGLYVARDGEFVAGVDVDVPSIRFGTDPHLYDREWADVGLLSPGRPGAPCARFVELLTGLVVTQEMVEGPLPYATLQ